MVESSKRFDRRMRKTHRDISPDKPKNKLPSVPKRDLILFHWSPSGNRERINRRGLDVNQRSLDGQWRPPYVCFSDDPFLAWHLSGNMWPEFNSWDLWAVNMGTQDSVDHYEIITDTYTDTGRRFVKEYRIYKRVYKRDVKYIGTRCHA